MARQTVPPAPAGLYHPRRVTRPDAPLMLLYDAVWALIVAGWAVSRPGARLLRGDSLGADRHRLGWVPVRPAGAAAAVWIHAVSVGELLSAAPVIAELKSRRPATWVLLSVGNEAAHRLALGRPTGADAVCRMPWDLSPCVSLALSRARPDAVVLTECELWPNLLAAAAARAVPVLMLNARVYPADFAGYRAGRRLFAPLLAGLAAASAQSAEDADRLVRLGVRPSALGPAGNTKYDAAPTAAGPPPQWLPRRAGPLWLLASTHAGEEAAILGRLGPLRERFPGLQVLIAPRHIARAAEVVSATRRAGLSVWRRTAPAPAAAPDVIVLDTLGELPTLHAAADVVFVGGTLADRGGHNPIEPAAGRAVIVGPSVRHFAAVVADLRAADAVRCAADADGVVAAAAELLADPAARQALGRRAAAVVAAGRGAARRFVDLLQRIVPRLR